MLMPPSPRGRVSTYGPSSSDLTDFTSFVVVVVVVVDPDCQTPAPPQAAFRDEPLVRNRRRSLLARPAWVSMKSIANCVPDKQPDVEAAMVSCVPDALVVKAPEPPPEPP